MHSSEKIESRPAVTAELPEFETAEAAHEWLKEQRLDVLTGYAGERMKEIAAPNIRERIADKMREAIVEVQNGSTFDNTRFAAALCCEIMAGLAIAQGNIAEGAAYGSIRTTLVSPEVLRTSATLLRSQFPEIASFLESGSTFLTGHKETLEAAAQRAAQILNTTLHG